MKTINLTDDQFDTLFEFVNQKVESIVDASVDYNDSEILNEWEDLLDVHTILEESKNIPNWVTIDYKDIWESKLSKDYYEIDCYGEHTYCHIFKREVK